MTYGANPNLSSTLMRGERECGPLLQLIDVCYLRI